MYTMNKYLRGNKSVNHDKNHTQWNYSQKINADLYFFFFFRKKNNTFTTSFIYM
jgi:hypothetical protein